MARHTDSPFLVQVPRKRKHLRGSRAVLLVMIPIKLFKLEPQRGSAPPPELRPPSSITAFEEASIVVSSPTYCSSQFVEEARAFLTRLSPFLFTSRWFIECISVRMGIRPRVSRPFVVLYVKRCSRSLASRFTFFGHCLTLL